MFEKLKNYSKFITSRLPCPPYVYTPPSGDIYGRDKSGRAWNLRSSILYALTVISSTGYNNVNVETNVGKILSVAYGLVGIPLMFITAANIGKLLSEMILFVCLRLQQKCCREGQYCVRQYPSGSGMDDLEVPAPFILALILGFCGLGALIYICYEPSWSFVQAYHVSFEGMISLVLADVGLNTPDYVLLLMSYKILSLSVLTMCLDLARVKLLRLFRTVHYFGRKIKFGLHHEEENSSTDLFTLLMDPRFRHILPEIIEAIYEDDPDRSDMLTSEDIFDYLRRLGDKQRILREQMNQAFVPQGFKYWKWVDQDTTRRGSEADHNSSAGDSAINSPQTGTPVDVDDIMSIDRF